MDYRVLDRGRKKIVLWVLVVFKLAIIMTQCQVISFVTLELKENWVESKQCKTLKERIWDDEGPMDKSFIEVTRCVFKDIIPAVRNRMVPKHKTLIRFDK